MAAIFLRRARRWSASVISRARLRALVARGLERAPRRAGIPLARQRADQGSRTARSASASRPPFGQTVGRVAALGGGLANFSSTSARRCPANTVGASSRRMSCAYRQGVAQVPRRAGGDSLAGSRQAVKVRSDAVRRCTRAAPRSTPLFARAAASAGDARPTRSRSHPVGLARGHIGELLRARPAFDLGRPARRAIGFEPRARRGERGPARDVIGGAASASVSVPRAGSERDLRAAPAGAPRRRLRCTPTPPRPSRLGRTPRTSARTVSNPRRSRPDDRGRRAGARGRSRHRRRP